MTNVRVGKTRDLYPVKGGFEKTKKKSAFRTTVLPLLILLIAALAIAGTAVLVSVLQKISKLDAAQASFVENLQLTAGTYDEQTIVLSNTNRYEAERTANRLGATLRLSPNGKYAVLYLPGDESILSVSASKENRDLIGQFTPNHYASISDIQPEEEEYELEDTLLPNPPSQSEEFTDTYYSRQTYLNYIHMGDRWNLYRGRNMTVAVIDTGIDTDHPEFAGRISDKSYNATKDKIVRDYDNDWSLIEDEQGHGTSVAGVIAAAANGEGIVGIVPEVNLVVIKAECTEEGDFIRTSDLVFGLYYAVECDVDVVNMSFTAPFDNFGDAAQLAVDSDILMVASTGNDGMPGLVQPASNGNVIAVGALKEDSWELADYSNYGDSLDLVAPGTVFTTALDGKYRRISGTSFAAPTVTGALALLKCVLDPYVTNEECLARLRASCVDLGTPGPDWYYGYGALDVFMLTADPGKVTYNMLTDELENTEGIYAVGRPIQDVPDPERLYAVFDGWYYDPECTDEMNWYEDEIGSSEITLYAKWVNEDDGIPFEYRVLDDGTVEIVKYRGKRRYITIPDYIEKRQVSSIGDSAFSGNTRLRRILLPHYLKNIGESAFEGCSQIVSYELPDGVERIGQCAFADNVRLKSITLGSSLREVGDFAFRSCGLLTSFSFPKTLESVNGSAFYGDVSVMHFLLDDKNKSFKVIDGVLYSHTKNELIAYPAGRTELFTLPNETKTIGVYAFACSGAYSVDLSTVKVIEAAAFTGARIRRIDIPDTCVRMDESAFAFCGNLSEVTLGKKLTEIKSKTFWEDGSIQKLVIPSGITRIEEYAFDTEGGSALTELVFEEGSKLSYIGIRAFRGKNSLAVLTLPDELVYIGEEGFAKCTSLREIRFGEQSALQVIDSRAFYFASLLKQVSLPDTVRIIGEFCFAESGLNGEVTLPASLGVYGPGIFASCHTLTGIRVDEANEFFKDVGGVVFTTDGKTLAEYPAGRPDMEYEIPAGTEILYDSSFYGSWELERITFPDSLRTIERQSFAECRWMTDYELNGGLEYIGEAAFMNNRALRNISLPVSVIQISRKAFAYDRLLEQIDIPEDTEMKRIGFQAFALSGIRSFRVPANVTSIAQYAFEDCPYLESVEFASGSKLESASAYLFRGCDSIRSVSFGAGSSLTSIQAHAFDGMPNLETISFGGAKITNFDNYAFSKCANLYSVEIPDTLENIGRFAFYQCKRLPDLTIPETMEHIGEYAFFATKDLNLYFRSELLPIYLDENWDNGLAGYYTGVSEVRTEGDWEFASLKNGTVALLGYSGNEKDLDLNDFPYGTVSVIGGFAFADQDLETVVLPDGLEQIQRYAFVNNKHLQSVRIPEQVTFIANSAFSNTGIRSLEFAGNRVKVIEQYAFAYTKQLESVRIPGSLEKMGVYAFYSSGLQTLEFAPGFHLTEIPEGAFAETRLSSVAIPDCVTVLNHNAFSYNQNLEEVDLGNADGLMIMSNVFYNTGLKHVKIGANVRFIGEYSFVGLEQLSAFEVDDDNPNYTAVDGILYNKDRTKIIAVPAGKTGSYTIPKGVEVIGFGAFENTHLSEILFAEDCDLATLGYRAFYGAKELGEITIPAKVISIDYYAFAECENLETVRFEAGNRLSGVYEGAFFGCRKLRNIILPDTVAEISDYAFYACESLADLPVGTYTELQGIYDYAFAYTGIEELTLPEQIRDVGAYAFRGCALKEFVFDPAEPDEIRLGKGVFADCNGMESITLPFTGSDMNGGTATWFGFVFGSDDPHYDDEFVPESLKNITITVQTVFNPSDEERTQSFCELPYVETVLLPDETVYIGDETFARFESLKTFAFPSRLIQLGHGAFFRCNSLESAVFYDDLVYIGTSCFTECTNLKEVRFGSGLQIIDGHPLRPGCFAGSGVEQILLPDSLQELGWFAFENCRNLKTVYVPEHVQFNGERMFKGCESLENVDIRCSELADSMFEDCHSLKTVDLPDGLTVIGNNSFAGCNALELIKLPDSLLHIGTYAFAWTDSLTEIALPDSVQTIGEAAFKYSGLTGIVIPDSVRTLGPETFLWSWNLKRVDFGSGLTSIPDYCCVWDYSLEEVILPGGLIEIGAGAFADCERLVQIRIPESVERIGNEAFGGCDNLLSLCLPEKLEYLGLEVFPTSGSLWMIENRSAIDLKEEFESGGVNNRLDGIYVLKDANGIYLKDVSEYGYRNCVRDGFVYEERDHETYLIGYAGDAESITIPYGNSPFDEESQSTRLDFHAPTVKAITVPEPYTTVSMSGNLALEELHLPATLTGFSGESLAYCDQIRIIECGSDRFKFENGFLTWETELTYISPSLGETVTVPEGIEAIGGLQYSRVSKLILPASLREVGFHAFHGNQAIRKVSFQGPVRIGHGAFSRSSLQEVDLSGCTFIDDWAFEGTRLKEVVIPGTVSSIGSYAFAPYGHSLEQVTIEEGVQTIGENAFAGNDGLKVISIPASVKEIGDDAIPDGVRIELDPDNPYFRLVDGLLVKADDSTPIAFEYDETQEEIVLPAGLTEIPDETFKDNTILKRIVIPEGVTRIGSSAFQGCTSLEDVVLPQSLAEICGHAFDGCVSLKEIRLPEELNAIRESAFLGTAISRIYLPASLEIFEVPFGTWWDGHASEYLEWIEADPANPLYFSSEGILYRGDMVICVPRGIRGVVHIPDGIYNAMGFDNSLITGVVLPDSVKIIGSGGFANCHLLETVEMADSIESIEQESFAYCENLVSINMSASIRTISNNVFRNCTSLEEVSFPDTAFTVEAWAFSGAGLRHVYIPANATVHYKAFEGCGHLETIEVAPEHETLLSAGNVVYGKQNLNILFAAAGMKGHLTFLEGVKVIPGGLFDGDNRITSVTLPESLTTIDQNAFHCPFLTTIRLPAGLRTIGENAFRDCTNLVYVINDSELSLTPGSDEHGMVAKYVRILDDHGTVTKLTVDGWQYDLQDDYIYSFYVEDDPYGDQSVGRLHLYVGNASEITLPQTIGGHPVEPYYFDSVQASRVVIPDGVKSIPWFAFYGNESMKEVVIPESVKEIGPWAFQDCYGLTEVVLPPKLQTLDAGAFWRCVNLKKVVLPYGLYEISDEAFGGCTSLDDFTIPDSVVRIGEGAFGWSGVKAIVLPEHLEIIGNGAFEGTALERIEIPKSVKSIGWHAFNYCEHLSEIILPDTPITICKEAFNMTAFCEDPGNWEGDFLYCGNHLIRYTGNEVYVRVEKDTFSIAEDAFAGSFRTRYLEFAGDAQGALRPEYLSSLELVLLRTAPEREIATFFATDVPVPEPGEGYYNNYEISVPNDLKQFVLGSDFTVDLRNEFMLLSGIRIYVENTKEDSPWDRLSPGWNNDNQVTYGDKWYVAEFRTADGDLINRSCFRTTQVIQLPYVVLPTSGEIGYKHVGWDIDGDGKPDGIPATRLSDLVAYAVVETTTPAVYNVRFLDLDRRTVLCEYDLEYGQPILLPETEPAHKGYLFEGWENYTDGMTVSSDIRIYSVWSHMGGGHTYEEKVIPPTCTEKGYTLHTCALCGDEYRTDYVDATWHTFADWVVDQDSTCQEAGSKHRVCTVCGFTEESIIDSVGHAYVQTVVKEPTCTEYGIARYVCSECHTETTGALPLIPHDYQKVKASLEYIHWLDEEYSGIVYAIDGNHGWYYTCSVCGKIQLAEAKVAGVNGEHRHELCAIQNGDGTDIAVRCPICGEVHCFEHDYAFVSEENGVSLYRCKNCGDERTEQAEYRVRFVDWDGTPLSEKAYKYGDTVVPPEDPKRAADETYTYAFAGWTPEVVPVAGDAAYTATYTATPNAQPVEIKLDTANGGQNGETTILIPSDGKTTLSKISSTTAAPDYILGDINDDGDIDGRDYIVVKKYVLGTADLTDRQLEIADINGDGEVDGIDYLLIKKHVLGTYTIPEPQPVEADGPDYADFAVIVVDANGKVQTVKQADGKSKSDLTVPTGGYAIAIPKAVLDANEALKNAIAALKANDTVTLNGVSLNEQGVAVVLKNASIVFQP